MDPHLRGRTAVSQNAELAERTLRTYLEIALVPATADIHMYAYACRMLEEYKVLASPARRLTAKLREIKKLPP